MLAPVVVLAPLCSRDENPEINENVYRPVAFAETDIVQLDGDLWVSWEEIKGYYILPFSYDHI